MNSHIFETLSPTKLFFRCALPSMVTMAFGALYQIADGIFVGRFIGDDALAAVNIIMPILMMVFAFSNMIATGASVRIAILLGEKKDDEASAVFSFSLKIIFLIACLFGIAGIVFVEPFVRLLAPGATATAIAYGITYTRIHATFSPFLLIYFATDNYLRVCGKEKLSMWLSIGTQALNILLDIILIAWLRQGIWAAALTNCLSMALGSLITLYLFCGKRMHLYYTHQNISIPHFFRLLANGSSELFSSISMSVMSVVLNFFLLKYGGTTALAAFSVVMYVDSIVGMLSFGMCDALQPAISYCYGAGQWKKVKAIFARVLLGACALSIVAMLFLFFAGPYVAPLFIESGNTTLLTVGIIGMKLFSFSYLTGWVDMCFSSFFTAIERPVRSLLTSLLGTLVLPVAFLFILTPFWGLNGVWLMPTVSGVAAALWTLCLALTMKHKA